MICLTIGLTVASMPPALADTLRWFSAGRPTATARQAVELLASAADDGLDARDYGADHLRKAIDGAASGPLIPDHGMAQIDLALTSAMVRYLADLHGGRVDPQRLAENFTPASARACACSATCPPMARCRQAMKASSSMASGRFRSGTA